MKLSIAKNKETHMKRNKDTFSFVCVCVRVCVCVCDGLYIKFYHSEQGS